MGWIRHVEPNNHRCNRPPLKNVFGEYTVSVYDLWQCDGCGTVWIVSDFVGWSKAGWWTQRKYNRSKGKTG